METVLITGGSGLIGTRLTMLLQQSGYEVIQLSRNPLPQVAANVYQWNIEEGLIDKEALSRADHIIHLAGATVATFWTASYKKKLIESRVKTAELIFEKLTAEPNKVKSFISSSAIGYYSGSGDQWIKEDDPPGTSFLSEICIEWENAALKFETLSKRVVMIRTGIVLATEGGTLPALMQPLRFGIAPVFGNGRQWYSWIHINDICAIYLFALKNHTLKGSYNAVSPQPVEFKVLMNAITTASNKRSLKLPVPAVILRSVLDGFGDSLLTSLRCSSDKIESEGFEFRYKNLNGALENLLMKNS